MLPCRVPGATALAARPWDPRGVQPRYRHAIAGHSIIFAHPGDGPAWRGRGWSSGQQGVQGGDGGGDVKFWVGEGVEQQSVRGGREQDRQGERRQVGGDGAALLLGADEVGQDLPVIPFQPGDPLAQHRVARGLAHGLDQHRGQHRVGRVLSQPGPGGGGEVCQGLHRPQFRQGERPLDGAQRGAGTKGELTLAALVAKPVYFVRGMPVPDIPSWVIGCITEMFDNFNGLKSFLKQKYPQ